MFRCGWISLNFNLTPECYLTGTMTIIGLFQCQWSDREWHELWWRHQMETFSALLAICAGNSPVPGEFPAQRPVTPSFDVCFDLRLNKRLSKQSWGWWFETQSRPLWRHSNVIHRMDPLKTGVNENRQRETNYVHILQDTLYNMHEFFGVLLWTWHLISIQYYLDISRTCFYETFIIMWGMGRWLLL